PAVTLSRGSARLLDFALDLAPRRFDEHRKRDPAGPLNPLAVLRGVLDFEQERPAKAAGAQEQHPVLRDCRPDGICFGGYFLARAVVPHRHPEQSGRCGLEERDVGPIVLDFVPLLRVQPRAIAFGWRLWFEVDRSLRIVPGAPERRLAVYPDADPSGLLAGGVCHGVRIPEEQRGQRRRSSAPQAPRPSRCLEPRFLRPKDRWQRGRSLVARREAPCAA